MAAQIRDKIQTASPGEPLGKGTKSTVPRRRRASGQTRCKSTASTQTQAQRSAARRQIAYRAAHGRVAVYVLDFHRGVVAQCRPPAPARRASCVDRLQRAQTMIDVKSTEGLKRDDHRAPTARNTGSEAGARRNDRFAHHALDRSLQMAVNRGCSGQPGVFFVRRAKGS